MNQRKSKLHIVNEDGESITLDAKHDEVLSKISLEEDRLPQLQNMIDEKKQRLHELSMSTSNSKLKRKSTLKHDHKTLHKNSIKSTNDMFQMSSSSSNNKNISSLSESLDLKEEIQSLKKEMREIRQKRNNYYLMNSRYIFKYFEKKQSIADASSPTSDDATPSQSLNSTSTKLTKNNSVNQFFKVCNESKPTATDSLHLQKNQSPNLSTSNNSLDIGSSISTQKQSHSSHDTLSSSTSSLSKTTYEQDANHELQRYLLNINEVNSELYHNVMPKDVCTHCSKGEMVMYDSDGVLICTNCSKITKYIIEHEKPSYKEPPKEVCFYAYKRINHFREILAQFQAKESTQIPEKVLEDFKMQIKKERIHKDQLTNKKAKEILKKLNHSKYYEHVPFIKDKIGIKPPVMDNTLEETLCNLFLEIQAPYAKYCPDSRVNFLNYYYTIYKLCELLDKRQFLEYFPMLKDKSKRIEQDNIWKNICKDLNWRFIATV